MSIQEQSISGFAEGIRSGAFTAEQGVVATLDALDASELNAFITVADRAAAIEAAREVDAKLAQGLDLPLLAGVPIAIKDNLCTEGVRTTAGSRMLEGFVPPYDATVVTKLKQAGAILIGKTNLDEFAMGSSNENSYFGAVQNPVQTDRVPGGSSGGSAAAVAADLCVAALGSDTGGSIRQPAALCGVVGLKPTYGRVSRFGLIAFASSLDQVGPLTKSVEDAAIMLEALSGPCGHDMTSMDVPLGDVRSAVNQGVEGMTLGIPREYFELEAGGHGMDPEVVESVRTAIQALKDAGATIVDISLPHTEFAVATYYLIATAEASSNLSRFDGIRYGLRDTGDDTGLEELYEATRSLGFGEEVKRRIMLGTYVLSAGFYDAYYKKAQQVRTLIRRDFEEAFKTVDAILTPTTPTPAFRHGEKTDDPLQMYLEDIFTISANLAGVPGISVPCGKTSEGLPIGLQVMAPAFDEVALFRVAGEWERRANQ